MGDAADRVHRPTPAGGRLFEKDRGIRSEKKMGDSAKEWDLDFIVTSRTVTAIVRQCPDIPDGKMVSFLTEDCCLIAIDGASRITTSRIGTITSPLGIITVRIAPRKGATATGHIYEGDDPDRIVRDITECAALMSEHLAKVDKCVAEAASPRPSVTGETETADIRIHEPAVGSSTEPEWQVGRSSDGSTTDIYETEGDYKTNPGKTVCHFDLRQPESLREKRARLIAAATEMREMLYAAAVRLTELGEQASEVKKAILELLDRTYPPTTTTIPRQPQPTKPRNEVSRQALFRESIRLAHRLPCQI